jgi:predicted permease
MSRLRTWIRRTRGVFARRRHDVELADELLSHLDAHVADNIRAGMTPHEARRRALVALGGVETTMDAYRDQQGLPWVEHLVRDLRFAARLLRRTPGFTVTAVATLGVAIGACTAMYSIVYGVVLRPLPYPRPEQLVQLNQVDSAGRRGRNFSDPNFEDVRDQTASFEAMAEFNQFGHSSVIVGGTPLRAQFADVSRGFFDVFRVEPAVGRRFSADESREGGPRALIVSQRFWREHFAGERDLSSAVLKVDGELHAVVGVMPGGFAFPPDTDLWVPREAQGRNPFRTGHNWRVVARLRDGVSLTAARADATAVARRLKVQYGQGTMMSDAAVLPLHDELVGGVRPILLLLLASVGLLLVVACASLANVLLARVTARRRELAVRAALGATGADITLPLIAESVIVAICGGLAGVAIAAVAVRTAAFVDAADLPHIGDIRLSWPVLLFALGVTWVTAIALSLLAAWRERRLDIVVALNDAQRGHTPSGSVGRLRNGLVVAQLVVSVVLLVGAGLLGRSLVALLRQNLGFRTTGVLAIDMTSPSPRMRVTPAGLRFDDPSALPRQARLNTQLIERLGALPGVADAGGISSFPLPGGGADGIFAIVADADQRAPGSLADVDALRKDPSRTGHAEFRVTSASYFRVMGISLLRGRLFDERDGSDAPHVAVISEALARARWPQQDPLGVHIQFGGMDGDLHVFTIVGVVADVRERGFDAPPAPTFYADYRQRPLPTFGFTFVVRTTTPSAAIIGEARRVLHELAPEVPPRFRTVEQIVDQSIAGRRFTFVLTVLFAGGALLVAVLGIYGVMAFLVAERSHEFGIRMALGARSLDVQRLVLGHAGALVLAGLTLGLAIAAVTSRLLSHQLFGIRPTDPMTYAAAAVLLACVALAACELPALRATRVDPMESLRAE